MFGRPFRARGDVGDGIGAQLRKLGVPLNRPADTRDIARLKDAVGRELPPELVALYRDHNGQAACRDWDYRLMSVDEVIELEEYRAHRVGTVLFDLHVLWTNNGSDYLALGLSGPLRGFVVMLEHDGDPVRLMFRSVESLYDAMILACKYARKLDAQPAPASEPPLLLDEAREQLHRNIATALAPGQRTDHPYVPFPVRYTSPSRYLRDIPGDLFHGTAHPALVESDRERVRELWTMFATADEDDRPPIASCLASLTPREDSEQLIPLLDDDDFFVAEAAAESLGVRKTATAYPRLVQLAHTGICNAKAAAWSALCHFPCDETLAMAIDALNSPGKEGVSGTFFLNLLVANGCEVRYRRSGGYLRYRLPGSTEWQVV